MQRHVESTLFAKCPTPDCDFKLGEADLESCRHLPSEFKPSKTPNFRELWIPSAVRSLHNQALTAINLTC